MLTFPFTFSLSKFSARVSFRTEKDFEASVFLLTLFHSLGLY